MVRHNSSRILQAGVSTTELIATVATLGLGLLLGFLFFAPESLSVSQPGSAAAAESMDAGPTTSQASATADPVRREDELTQQVRQLQDQLATIADQMVASSAGGSTSSSFNQGGDRSYHAAPATSGRSGAAAQHAMGQRTLKYWNKLNDIMLKEEQMRRVPAGGLTKGNVANFLSGRGRAGKYAAEQFRKLPIDGVDPEVVALAHDIAAWYEHGNGLNNQANFLLNEADGSTRRGAAGQQWQNAEKSHHKSVAELNRRGDDLRERLIERYGLPFPDLR